MMERLKRFIKKNRTANVCSLVFSGCAVNNAYIVILYVRYTSTVESPTMALAGASSSIFTILVPFELDSL